jgi:anti-sigma-K factor RskA
MRPQDHPEVIDSLAAEYVLGTLRGQARRRFEKWRANTPLVAERCRFWEDNLMALAKGLRPVRPPPHVWQGIRARLNLTRQDRKRRGRPWAIAATLLLVVGLSALLYWRSIEPGRLTAVATIATPTGAQLWEVDLYRETGQLVMRTAQVPAHAADRDFELWALPAGGKPVSLGVMPGGGTAQRKLTDAQKVALAGSAQVAITVEQLGGSPNGQPTTTPIYVAPLRTPS